MKEKRSIHVLLMPTDACNMNCVYCFHASHHGGTQRMTPETLRRFYELVAAEYTDVDLIWHGGEPLLMGTDFYRAAVEMQKEYPHARFQNSMQSNLTLVDEHIAACLKEQKIRIGSSFDGVRNEDLRGHSAEILQKRQLLAEHGVGCGFIMVVSGKNIDFLTESYEFFKGIGADYNMNLYVSADTPMDRELKLDPEYAAEKICAFFDYWLSDTQCSIRISYFEQLVDYLTTGKKTVCRFNSCLGRWAAVRWDGEIVPCNRYFPKEYSYGNVWDLGHWSQIYESKGFRKLLQEAVRRRKKCSSCPAYGLCEGGCNNVALNENGIANNGGPSCRILRQVYAHVQDKLEELARKGTLDGKNPRLTARWPDFPRLTEANHP